MQKIPYAPQAGDFFLHCVDLDCALIKAQVQIKRNNPKCEKTHASTCIHRAFRPRVYYGDLAAILVDSSPTLPSRLKRNAGALCGWTSSFATDHF